MKNDNQKITIPQSFADDFKSRCETMPNGCISYLGAHTVRIPVDAEIAVRFVSPRRAAYLIKHKQMPTREVKLVCHTPTCVNPKHFIEGRERREFSEHTVLDGKKVAAIEKKFAAGGGKKSLAREYGISMHTLLKILPPEKP